MSPVKIRLTLLTALLAIGALLVVVNLPANRESSDTANQTGFAQTLQWDDLLPDQQTGTNTSTTALRSDARTDLEGKRVAIAGYMTPFNVSEGETRTFLLVPYMGACIHVPAPPPNQIVLVESAEPVPVRSMYEPFTATGTLHVELIDTGVAPVGYTMKLDRMGPYTNESAPLESIRSANDGD